MYPSIQQSLFIILYTTLIMSGVLFVVCIPTYEQEKKLRKATSSTPPEGNQLVDIKLPSVDNLKNVKSTNNLSVPCEGVSLRRSRSEDVFLDMEPQSVSAASSKSCINDESVVSDKTSTTPTNLSGHREGTMEQVLDKLLKRLKIDNAVWCSGKCSTYYQVLFSVGSGEIIEETLQQLHECGIGTTSNSVVSVIPCSLYYEGIEHTSTEDDASDEGTKKDPQSVSAWDRFVLSVRARLTVAQVVERVKSDACLTFDFLVLLLIAGVVSALGLVENSTIFLVASMLISPLMGPIMAGTFGTVIEDRRLQKMGVLNELFGLFICVLVGFVFGLAVGSIDDYWGKEQLPTEEMLFRGEIRSLWVGVLIALPSGAAVAIALLGDNTGSLVGVAISASLLPPAVNAGLLWSLACVHLLWTDNSLTPNNSTLPITAPNINASAINYVYSENVTVELAILGAVSLCLTLVNIICIFITGILVLKVKEVSPRTSGKESQFWHHDIKIARDYNKTLNQEEGKQLEKQLADELAGYKDLDFTKDSGRKYYHVSPELYSNRTHRFVPRHQQTWSPMMRQDGNTRLSLQELESLYATLTGTAVTHSPGTRIGSPWLTIPETSSTLVPSWLRHSNPSPTHVTLPEPGLPTIQESMSTPIVKQQTTRRVSLPSIDSRHAASKKKRFFVSAVDEDSYME